MKNFYITTPIYYVNDLPHIGHAYTTIVCDIIARFKKLDGFNVLFMTGTDEHGQKVEKSALAKNINPQEFTDNVSQNFRDLMPKLNIQHDDFIRTTEDRHKKAVAELWKRLMDNGYIYLGKYRGWYSVRDEAFYQENEIIDGKAPTGAPVEWVEEPSYFFKLSAFQDKLLEYYEKHPSFILPQSRKNEVISFVKSGLTDLSISRTTFKWGIPVPNDPSHIIYVWLDALTNYLTVAGFPDTSSEKYNQFWPASVHMVGKDILRFHAIYWPAFLMAADLPLPERVFAHGWWTNEGQKISKSLGNAIDPIHLVEEYGVDPIRYFLIREVSFGQDGDFSLHALKNRINNDLANSYGNLVQRVLSFVFKNCNGEVPSPSSYTQEDQNFLEIANNALNACKQAMETQSLHKVCDIIWNVIAEANRYVDFQKPWEMKKTDIHRMNTILYILLNVIKKIALLTYCIIPESSAKILSQLNLSEINFKAYDDELKPGHKINTPEPIFKKVE